jgi:hypothetical protein
MVMLVLLPECTVAVVLPVLVFRATPRLQESAFWCGRAQMVLVKLITLLGSAILRVLISNERFAC